jgi:hypothetical protein
MRTKEIPKTFVLSDRWSCAILSNIRKILVTHTPRAVTRSERDAHAPSRFRLHSYHALKGYNHRSLCIASTSHHGF